jgi:hypothetical protein
VNGNVVSKTSQKYITNLLAATAAKVTEVAGDSSGDSDNEVWAHIDVRVGNMDAVRKALDGIASRSTDDGARGFGRYASTIRIGRELWRSPDLPTDVTRNISERFFDDGTFPPTHKVKKEVEKLKKVDESRPEPFTGRTLPNAHLTVANYGKRIDEWFATIMLESEIPNHKQLGVLEQVRTRILIEFRLEKEGTELRKGDPVREREEEPMRSFVHGPPGTGKNKLISWIRRFFTEALGWEHGMEFVFLAFQNRVAYAMGGTTLHAGGDIAIGGQASRQLSHTDLDILFTRNQHLRWVLFDEVGMIADDLLGAVAEHFSDAALQTRYAKRADKSVRIMGGYNIMLLGDLFQLPPIPASAAIFTPPTDKQNRAGESRGELILG